MNHEPTASEESVSGVPEQASITKVKPETVLRRLDKKVEKVQRRTAAIGATRGRVRKRYLQLNSYLKQLNELRKAQGLPIVTFVDNATSKPKPSGGSTDGDEQ